MLETVPWPSHRAEERDADLLAVAITRTQPGRADLAVAAVDVKAPNGLYKAEVIHRRGPWRSFEAVEFATLTWVDWFNHRRLLEPIGNIPPIEAEERYYALLDVQKRAA